MTCDTMPTHPTPAPAKTGSVVAFPAHRLRQRDVVREDGPRGEILLFLGVRYERMPEVAETAPRRRRRS